jgi:hypothetical protein
MTPTLRRVIRNAIDNLKIDVPLPIAIPTVQDKNRAADGIRVPESAGYFTRAGHIGAARIQNVNGRLIFVEIATSLTV